MTRDRVLLIGGGYVGSYVYETLSARGMSVACCDRRDLPWVSTVGRYQDLSAEAIGEFSEILWFAGHSSVAMAEGDPMGALENNCLDLLSLARRMRRGAWLTYASTASLYSSVESSGSCPSTENDVPTASVNAYDASKAAFDLIAARFLDRTTGLRMGTVSGFSRDLRRELIFNAMVTSAAHEGVVRVSNGECQRTLLFLRDLGIILENLLARRSSRPRLINCGSINITISQLADAVADRFDAEVQTLRGNPTYSFAMDLSLAESEFGLKTSRVSDLRREMDDLAALTGGTSRG